MRKKPRSVSDINTAVSAKLRSRPRLKRAEFLDMFILEKNKVRLEQERENLSKRVSQIEKDISVLDGEIEILNSIVAESKDKDVIVDTGKHEKKQMPPKPMTMMKIDY